MEQLDKPFHIVFQPVTDRNTSFDHTRFVFSTARLPSSTSTCGKIRGCEKHLSERKLVAVSFKKYPVTQSIFDKRVQKRTPG